MKQYELQTLAKNIYQICPVYHSMAQSSPDHKHKDEPLDSHQENGKVRKANTQQSLNTKNFLKKMTSKKVEQEQKAQPKITSFMNFSNSTSFGGGEKEQKEHSSQQQRIRDLEERMKQRDLQIDKMKRAKEFDENRYSTLFLENKEFKKKARDAIAKSMLEAAECRRAERREINPRFGYFKDGTRNFVEGSLTISIKEKIHQKQQMIRSLQQDKKSKDSQRRQRATFKSQFLQRQLVVLQKQLQSVQNTINLYKEQLKLADKEMNCEYAQMKWPVVYDQYQALELLGKGGFGEVYKCFDLEGNQVVAVKVNSFVGGDPAQQEELFKYVQREAEQSKKFSHPNIAKFLKLLECSNKKIVFALEYCSGPQLSNYLKKNTCLQQKQAKQIIRQIFSALHYLSTLKQKVIHYDLKPSNIIFHYGLVKIVDFGLCKPMTGEQSRINLTSQGVGTYWYLPPQTYEEHFPQISPKVDVWSAGVVFYEMLYAKKPFGHGMSQDKIMNEDIIVTTGKKLEFPAENPKKYKVSEAAKNFIRQCLAYYPNERLSATEAYEHEYFKK